MIRQSVRELREKASVVACAEMTKHADHVGASVTSAVQPANKSCRVFAIPMPVAVKEDLLGIVTGWMEAV